MINIKYPKFDFKIKKEDNKEIIYDEIRRRWVALTPEEWVRQNFIQYLIQTKKYPSSLIAVEKEIKVGEQKKRFDVVVYKDSLPWLIVECKQMNVSIQGNVLSQVLAYNSKITAHYIALTNGNTTFLWHIILGNIYEVNSFPDWK
ncbi:MAG: type I restriction enzyme HsdR N-terminal domain-containing protein [Chitinophagaceae bacterium]